MSDPGKFEPYPPRQQSSSAVFWIVILVLVLVIGVPILLVALILLGCCGILGLGAATAFQVPANAARQQFGSHPVIQEHIGEIQSISMNAAASGEEQQRPAAAGKNVIVFDVSGPKGSGQLIAEHQPGDPSTNQPDKFFSKATLRTSRGEFPITW